MITFLILLSNFSNVYAADPVAFECSYNLYNKEDGTLITSGTFSAVLNKQVPIQIDNPVSKLATFNVVVKSEFRSTMPGGDGIDYLAIHATSERKKDFFTTYENGGLSFGDNKVMGFISIQKSQSFYFQHAHGWVLLGNEWFKPNLYSSLLAQVGSCVGGEIQDAANYILKNEFPSILENSLTAYEQHIEWIEIKNEECIGGWSEDERGRSCLEWKTSQHPVTLPKCSS